MGLVFGGGGVVVLGIIVCVTIAIVCACRPKRPRASAFPDQTGPDLSKSAPSSTTLATGVTTNSI